MMADCELMTPELWKKVRYFSPEENFGRPFWMCSSLIFGIDKLRDFIGKPIIVTCGWEKRDMGYHPLGKAVDLICPFLHPVDFFLAASRFDIFNGLGLYSWWSYEGRKVGGIHVDVRPKERRFDFDARWFSPKRKVYIQLSWNVIRAHF